MLVPHTQDSNDSDDEEDENDIEDDTPSATRYIHDPEIRHARLNLSLLIGRKFVHT